MMKLLWPWSSIAVTCLMLVAACGDDGGDSTNDGTGAGTSGTSGGGTGTGAGGQGTTSSTSATGGGGAGAAALSFVSDIWPILAMPRDPPLSGANDSCSGANGCHLGGAGGLVLPSSAAAYANLIDAPSNSALCAGMLEVVAAKPDESCFVVFYEQRLRDQLGWVEQAETDLVRAWVEQGAAP